MKFEDRVLNNSFRLTDLEDDIINYLNREHNHIQEIKISQLASYFYTVPNTVTRLSHKLGYSGFSELKHAIMYEQDENLSDVDYQHILIQNFELIDHAREHKLCELFAESNKINFYSVGQTSYVTRIIVDNFYSVDNKSFFYLYPNELEHVINRKEKDISFFISLSGEKHQILEMAEKAKASGHTVISLTHLSNNSLSKISDYQLYCYSPEERIDEYNITDKTPVLIIMNSLFRKYVSQLNKKINQV